MSVGETGFISEKGGGLIEEEVVKGFIRIQIAARRGENPERKSSSHDQ